MNYQTASGHLRVSVLASVLEVLWGNYMLQRHRQSLSTFRIVHAEVVKTTPRHVPIARIGSSPLTTRMIYGRLSCLVSPIYLKVRFGVLMNLKTDCAPEAHFDLRQVFSCTIPASN